MTPTESSNKYVKPWMTFLAGVLLWLPGIGIPTGLGRDLQLIDIFVFSWFFLGLVPILIRSRRVQASRYLVYVCGGLFVNWILSSAFSMDVELSLVYLTYYVLFILPAILFFYYLAEDGFSVAKFLNGFMSGAIVSAILGLMQLLFGRHIPPLVNNDNFFLITGLNKASAFTPEASVLAGLLIIALAIVLSLFFWDKQRNYFKAMQISHFLADPFWLKIIFFIVVLGLSATLSTSVIIVLPFIVIAVSVFSDRQTSRRTIMVLTLAFFAFIYLFYHFVWIKRGWAAYESILMRAASMAVAVKIGISNWVHGAGLGLSRSIIADPAHDLFHAWGRPIHFVGCNAKNGVDSFILHLFAEQGILIVLLTSIIIIWIVSARVRPYLHYRSYSLSSMLSLIAISTFIVGALSVGYRGLVHLWLIFPFSAAVHSMSSREG